MASLFCTPENYDKTSVLQLDDGATYFPIRVEPIAGKSINNDPKHELGINALIAGLNITSDTRTQFVSTLGTDIYAYTFGETLDNITISGYGFIPCEGDSNGFLDIIDFWNFNNVGRHGLACYLYIDKKLYKGYLVTSEVGATDKALGLFPFKLEFNSVQIT